MHLDVTRSGGVTGLTRRWSAEVPDPDCARLVLALEDAHKTVQSSADERMYEIHLGKAWATVPERHTHFGPLAALVVLAQNGGRTH